MNATLQTSKDQNQMNTIQTESPALTPTPTPYGLIPKTQDLEELIDAADLDYQVEASAIQYVDQTEAIPAFVGIRRVDQPHVTFNIPTNGYKVVQNREVLTFSHPLVQATNGAYTRAGFFKKGASIFAFAQMPDKIKVSNTEELGANIVIQSSHDGSASVSLTFLVTRTVAGKESLVPFLSRDAQFKLAYRHTKNASLKLEEVASLIARKDKFFGKIQEMVLSLSKKQLTDEEATAFLNRLLEIDPDAEKIPARREESRDQIMAAYRREANESVRGTCYAMLMAVADYRNHTAPTRTMYGVKTDEARMSSTLQGTNSDEISKAWNLLMGFKTAQLLAAQS